MKWRVIVSALIAAVCFAACGGTNKESEVKSKPDSYMALSGLYSDTIPCPDCDGVVVSLMLYPDSTFMLRERRLSSEAAPMGNVLTGTYDIASEQGRIALTARYSSEKRLFALSENALSILDSIGNTTSRPGDWTLERMDRIVSTGRYHVRYLTAEADDSRSRVFTRAGKDEIIIDKNFIDHASEAEKSILAFYAIHYEGGCDSSTCAFLSALGLDQDEAKKLSAKWMGADVRYKELADTIPSVKRPLSLLFVNRIPSGLQVTLAYTDDQDTGQTLADIFEIDKKQVKWLSRSEGEVKRQVIDRNPNRPARYPEQGGKQIIDMKRLKESKKKSGK